jgi:hypothetical protein
MNSHFWQRGMNGKTKWLLVCSRNVQIGPPKSHKKFAKWKSFLISH